MSANWSRVAYCCVLCTVATCHLRTFQFLAIHSVFLYLSLVCAQPGPRILTDNFTSSAVSAKNWYQASGRQIGSTYCSRSLVAIFQSSSSLTSYYITIELDLSSSATSLPGIVQFWLVVNCGTATTLSQFVELQVANDTSTQSYQTVQKRCIITSCNEYTAGM